MAGLFCVLLALVATFQSVKAHECGFEHIKEIRVAKGMSGEVKSRYYPKPYPLWTNCYYRITTYPGYVIRLSFVDLDMDAADYCHKDFIAVHDGGETHDPIIGYFCGSIKPRDVQTHDNSMLIIFNSDFVDAGRGFHFKYTSVPEDTPFCPKGQLECKNRKCVPETAKCNTVDDCDDGTDEEGCVTEPTQPDYTCGTPKISPRIGSSEDRIMGGSESLAHSWPWQVSFNSIYAIPSGHFCGGTLISDTWVLTAAHCLERVGELFDYNLRLGLHDKYRLESNEVTRYIKRVLVYNMTQDEYFWTRKFSWTHDLAMLQLSAPVTFSDHILPACLPNADETTTTGATCFATGWGSTKGTGNPETLKQISAKIAQTNETEVTVEFPAGEGACSGDSGGPLVCKQPSGRWTLMGVASYIPKSNHLGPVCGFPAQYGRVAGPSHRQWIRDTMEKYK